MPRPVFFDTPMFGHRMFGDRQEQMSVEALVTSRSVVTSRYVLEQYKSTFLRSAILLHTLLQEHRSIGTVIRELDKFPRKPRDATRARMILATLDDGDPHGTIEDKLSRLERWIEWEILDTFADGVEIVDATGCCLCATDVSRNAFGIYSLDRQCRINPRKPCKIEEFWDTRHAMLEAVSVMPTRKVAKGVADAQAAANDVINDNKPCRGERCWVALSDAVIVAESPDEADLATTNIKDFAPLAEAIGGGRLAFNPLQPTEQTAQDLQTDK